MFTWKTTTLAASIVAASLALAATTVAAGELGLRHHHHNPGPFPPGVGSHHHGHVGPWLGGGMWGGPNVIELGGFDDYGDCEMLRQRAVDDFGNVYLRRVRVCG